MANPDESCELLTLPEAAERLRLKPSTLRAWILKRRIAFVKLGGRVFIRRTDVEALISRSLIPAELTVSSHRRVRE
jgi:excisionase family DNA binding protein